MESDYVNDLSKTLRAYRKEYGLSVAELAPLLGVSHDTVSKLERGVTLPTLPTLRSMMRLFEFWTIEDLGALILNLPEEPRLRYFMEAPNAE